MMYYKMINGQEVFSTCASILMLNGSWVSNPTPEMIADAGWQVYVPPVVPPTPLTDPSYEEVVEAVKKMFSTDVTTLTDEEALEVAALYPTWSSKLPKGDEQVGEPVVTGDRLWDDGELWKVLQPHNVMLNWRPKDSPSLYVEVSIVEWPEWVQPTGAQDAYNTGDRVTYKGHRYTSLIDANVYSPEAYPAGWKQED